MLSPSASWQLRATIGVDLKKRGLELEECKQFFGSTLQMFKRNAFVPDRIESLRSEWKRLRDPCRETCCVLVFSGTKFSLAFGKTSTWWWNIPPPPLTRLSHEDEYMFAKLSFYVTTFPGVYNIGPTRHELMYDLDKDVCWVGRMWKTMLAPNY